MIRAINLTLQFTAVAAFVVIVCLAAGVLLTSSPA
jgi:hypothetical protein